MHKSIKLKLQSENKDRFTLVKNKQSEQSHIGKLSISEKCGRVSTG